MMCSKIFCSSTSFTFSSSSFDYSSVSKLFPIAQPIAYVILKNKVSLIYDLGKRIENTLSFSQDLSSINNFGYKDTYYYMTMAEKISQESTQNTSKELEIHLRRQKVWDLMLQGFTQEQIAEKLDVSTKTISRDAIEIKKDSIRWLDTLTRGQIQMYHRSNFETIERVSKELWQLFETTEDDKLKVKILKTISENRKTLATLMERFDLMKLGYTLHEVLSPAKGGIILDDTFAPKRQEIDYDKIVN